MRGIANFKMRFCLIFAVLVIVAAVSAQWNPHYANGHQGIVHLFEWKYSDIANECEHFLGPRGYAGVQLSPVSENVIVENRPWWERYQPISYHLKTRSGDEVSLIDMARRCNDAGVRIYVDAVINHMTQYQAEKIGTGGSTAESDSKVYYAVPYGPEDFHETCAVSNYTSPENIRNCELNGLHDLNQTRSNVRDNIVNFMNKLIDAGVAGFRIDAAKHQWPEDLEAIFSRLKNLSSDHHFADGSRPFLYQEVIDNGGEAVSSSEYTHMGTVTEFKHSFEISKAFMGQKPLKELATWGSAAGNFLPSKDALVFVDNHDNQRGHGAGGNILTHKKPRMYKMAVAFMLAHTYGIPRVMSSFFFNDTDAGPPADDNGNTISPVSSATDHTCINGWVCEHRWPQIYNMIGFRNAVAGTTVHNWWDNGGNQIALSRGDAGFIAINGENFDMKQSLQTRLPPGEYCDIISGNVSNGRCTGKIVSVDCSGLAFIEILSDADDGSLAIHVNAKI